MLLILNSSLQVIGTLARFGTTNKVTPYFNDKHIIDLATGAETLTFSTFASTSQAYKLRGGNYIAFQEDNGYKLFQISEVIEEHTKDHIKTAYCEMAGIELTNDIIRATNMPSANLKQALTYALQDTEYQVGKVDASIVDVHSIELKEPMKAYDFIQKYIIGLFGAEISFRVEIQGGRVIGKYIDCYRERGEFSGIRFTYGKHLSKVKKTEDVTELATALVCIGKNGTTISSEEADDKPRGQDWIGDEKAYRIYNRKGSHIFDTFKFDTESPAELLREARKALKERSKPKLKYEVDVELLGKEVNIGDTVYIIDNEFDPPLHLSARVSKIEKQRTVKNGRNDKVVLANYKEVVSKITDEDRNIASIIDERFPIKSPDISNGAVTSDKIPSGAVNGTHIIKDSITTEHLEANSITSDKIEAGQIKAEHILADQIKTEHLKANSIDATKIKADSIESTHIKADQINSNHISSNSIESDHIKAGQVVSDHILANQIKSEHIIANAITSDKILAGAITTEKLEADSVTAEKILAGSISTDHLQANSVTTGKLNAYSVTADKISANAITSDKIEAGQILAKHIKAGEITADKIGANQINTNHLVANAITSDKIGANQITATHIKSGSITADKVTTEELITNSAQIKTGIINSAHIGNGQITNAHIGKGAIGEANILDASITSAKIANASITSAKIGNAQIETAHIKELSANVIKSGKINTGLIEVAGTNGKLKIKDNRLQVFDNSEVAVERVSLGDVDGNGTKYGLRVRGADGKTILYDENGVYNEGITDGAITNPKIDDDSIDSRTLNLKELFVEDSAFIENLQATKINASQLVVDEIRNDLINLSGLISFDSLNPELNDLLFIKDADKTYINGNTILTNTIKASQIDLYEGLNVKKDGLDTFSVATDGSVKVSGTIESFGFSNEEGEEKGYRLTPDGDAYLNDAIVRGSVILPSAGVTNYGKNYQENLVDGGVVNLTSSAYGFGQRGVALKPKTTYTATLNGSASEKALEEGKALVAYIYTTDWEWSTFVRISDSSTTTESLTFTTPETFTSETKINFYCYPNTPEVQTEGTVTVNWVKVEEGDSFTGFIESNSQGDLVRFWAGASYEDRNEAPFKVYESGKIVATEGEFGGTFTGELNIGNIRIKDTDTTSAELSIKTNGNTKEVIRLTDTSARFDVDFSIGDVFKANVQTKEVDFGVGTSLDLEQSGGNKVTLNKATSTDYTPIDIRGTSGGVHKFITKNGYGGLVLEASGTKVTAGIETPYDFKFTRDVPTEAVNVVVKGNLVVDNKITMADENKIELVSVSGVNSGIDFMIR